MRRPAHFQQGLTHALCCVSLPSAQPDVELLLPMGGTRIELSAALCAQIRVSHAT